VPVPVPAGFLPAPFLERCAALGIDAVLLALLVLAIVYGVNAIARPLTGPVFDPFWEEKRAIATEALSAHDDVELLRDGTRRESTIRTEARRYETGDTRIYVVVDSRFRRPDGRVETQRYEERFGQTVGAWIRFTLTSLLMLALPLACFTRWESAARRASPGKRIFGLVVTDMDGRRLGPRRAFVRQLGKLFELSVGGLGYVLACFTDRRQAFHDILTRTRVLKLVPTPAAPLGAAHPLGS